MSAEQVRLTQLTHGGGGGCKVAPDILEKILSGIKPGIVPPQLLIGKESSDDAAVYQISAQQAIVATTDFFTPIVDDPFDFGRIAATTAISNVYAMGATPLFALALVGMPVSLLPLETIGKVLEGGESV
ncbi:MAG: selenide, water dikinase SelD, partial [Azonexus sp.]